MKITKYKRRTFKEVASDAYAKGWSDGCEQGRKDVEKDYDALLATNKELHERLRETTWSRITGLFKGSPS
jgi:flagellar biosynthesis/type III secretory pathway protein FliH